MRRTLGALVWTSSGAGVHTLLQFAVLAILARLLVPEDFGLVGAALVIVTFADMFSQLGVGPALVQRPDLSDAHLSTGFTVATASGVLAAALILLIADDVAGFFRMAELEPVLQVLALVFPLQAPAVVAESLLQREMRFRSLTLINLTSYAIGYGIIGVSLGLLGSGAWALVWARLSQAVIRTAILLVVQPHPKHLQLRPGPLRDLMAYGGGITIHYLFGFFAMQGDKLVIGRWLGAEALGLYGRAYQMMVAPANVFGEVVDKVLSPPMAKIQDERLRLAAAYRRGAALTALLVMPLSAALFILAPEVIRILLGAGWSEAVLPFQILTLGMFLRTGYKMADTLACSKGAVYGLAWRKVIYAVLVVGGAWSARRYGVAGVASAVLVALVVEFLLGAWLSLRLVGMRWRDFALAHRPALISTVVVGAVVLVIAASARQVEATALLTLVAALVGAAGTMLALARLAPSIALGPEGIWLVEATGRSHLRLQRVADFAIGRDLAVSTAVVSPPAQARPESHS